jgi:hypothetical protein
VGKDVVFYGEMRRTGHATQPNDFEDFRETNEETHMRSYEDPLEMEKRQEEM